MTQFYTHAQQYLDVCPLQGLFSILTNISFILIIVDFSHPTIQIVNIEPTIDDRAIGIE